MRPCGIPGCTTCTPDPWRRSRDDSDWPTFVVAIAMFVVVAMIVVAGLAQAGRL